MKQPLNTCCLCCELETGAYTLSAVGLFGSIFMIITSSLMLDHIMYATVSENSLIARIIACVASVFLYILLIIGTKKRNSCLLLPYLILNMLGLVLQTFGLLYIIVTTPYPPLELIGLYFASAIGIALATYIWMCMMSLYAKIRNDKLNPGPVCNQYSMNAEPTKMQSE